MNIVSISRVIVVFSVGEAARDTDPLRPTLLTGASGPHQTSPLQSTAKDDPSHRMVDQT